MPRDQPGCTEHSRLGHYDIENDAGWVTVIYDNWPPCGQQDYAATLNRRGGGRRCPSGANPLRPRTRSCRQRLVVVHGTAIDYEKLNSFQMLLLVNWASRRSRRQLPELSQVAHVIALTSLSISYIHACCQLHGRCCMPCCGLLTWFTVYIVITSPLIPAPFTTVHRSARIGTISLHGIGLYRPFNKTQCFQCGTFKCLNIYNVSRRRQALYCFWWHTFLFCVTMFICWPDNKLSYR